MTTERLSVELETRASESGPMLHATILQEGRAATGIRRELFTPGAVTWPADGIGVLLQHHGEPQTRAVPTREANGEIRIAAKATPAVFEAVRGGRRFMSVEFFALEERTTPTGIREVQRALVTAATVTDDPEYDSTAAEVRERRGPRLCL